LGVSDVFSQKIFEVFQNKNIVLSSTIDPSDIQKAKSYSSWLLIETQLKGILIF
jgi:hypothetical protein